jgi:Ca2+-binding EF-hand superfamily protein
MRLCRFFLGSLPFLLLTTLCWLPVYPAAAQDAPPHEGEGYSRQDKAKASQKVQPKKQQKGKAVAASKNQPAQGKAALVSDQRKAARNTISHKTSRGPAVKNDGKPYMRSLDKNHDGRISHEEFMAGSKKRFAKADTNHDGIVSLQEAKAAKAKLLEKQAKRDAKRLAAGKPVKHRAKTARPPKPYLSTFDKNKDGRVSQKEYLERREKKFHEMDANHDGVISREEARVAKVKLLERREERKAQAKARRLRKIEEAKVRKNVEGTMSSTGPELTAPVTPPPAAAPQDPASQTAQVPSSAAPAPRKQPDLPLTPIAPEVPAQVTPET